MSLPGDSYLVRRPRDFFLITQASELPYPTASKYPGAFLLDATSNTFYWSGNGQWNFVGVLGQTGGVLAGGSTHQVLRKLSDDDFDTEWFTFSGLSGGRAYVSFNATGPGQTFNP